MTGGAGDEHTLRGNAAAFARWELRPRVLVDVGSVTTATTVLGAEVALPVLVAPTAFQRLCDPEGELATARAAARAGTVMCQSTLSSVTPAELAAAAPGAPQWFQLYWSRDRGFTQELVTAAAEAGFSALMLTVDLPVAGRRERDVRAAFALPDDLPLPNLPQTLQREDFHTALHAVVDDTLTWRDLEWLQLDLPAAARDQGDPDRTRTRCWRPSTARPRSSSRTTAAASSTACRRRWTSCPRWSRRSASGSRCWSTAASAVAPTCSRRSPSERARRSPAAPCSTASRPAARRASAQVLELLRRELELGLKLLGCTSPAEVTAAHVRAATL